VPASLKMNFVLSGRSRLQATGAQTDLSVKFSDQHSKQKTPRVRVLVMAQYGGRRVWVALPPGPGHPCSLEGLSAETPAVRQVPYEMCLRSLYGWATSTKRFSISVMSTASSARAKLGLQVRLLL